MIIGDHDVNSISLKYLYERFKQLQSEGIFGEDIIKTVTIGDIFEVEAKAQDYPLLHVATESVAVDTGRMVYNFQLILMDLVSKDESNEEDVLSDTLDTMKEIFGLLKNRNYTFNAASSPQPEDFLNMVRLQDSISCEPFTERFDNEVAGWTANIQIEVMFDFATDNCLT